MVIILLFSIKTRAEKEKLKELLNVVFWKKFHNYGNKSIKNRFPSGFTSQEKPDIGYRNHSKVNLFFLRCFLNKRMQFYKEPIQIWFRCWVGHE